MRIERSLDGREFEVVTEGFATRIIEPRDDTEARRLMTPCARAIVGVAHIEIVRKRPASLRASERFL